MLLFCRVQDANVLMVARKITDWIGVSIPGFFISSIFILIPFLLMVTALEIMRVPGQGFGVGVPGLQLNHKYELESKSFHDYYPNDYEVSSMKQQFKFKQHELQTKQDQYDKSGDSLAVFLKKANNIAGNIFKHANVRYDPT